MVWFSCGQPHKSILPLNCNLTGEFYDLRSKDTDMNTTSSVLLHFCRHKQEMQAANSRQGQGLKRKILLQIGRAHV